MDLFGSKIKSTPLTLDTYAPNSSTYGLSLFEKDQKDIHDTSNPSFSYPTDCYSVQEEQSNVFSLRFKTDIRQKYIYRVLGTQENQQLPSLKHQHVFIFDWDDTLLFTTYLKGKKITEFGQETKNQLKQLDDIVCSILEYSLKKGFVFIITNSINGWINYSSKVYLPGVHKKIVSSQKIKLWSARQLFQKHYPNDLKMWKVETFKKLKEYLHTNILTNVICVGNREDDLEACQVLVTEFDLIYIKKIKLQQKPRPVQLIKQLKLLQKKFKQIFHAIANTTIKLQKRILTPQTIRKEGCDDICETISPKKEKK